jgi:3-isopropylmalate/(R)-2-methylmalate dehydratase small subunit
MIISGKVWRLGDNVDTDQILPGQYINIADRKERASHCLENIYPGFASAVSPGEILVAGDNFGCGSSRPSVEILQALKLAGVVAKSFARIFFRGAIARGFPLIICSNMGEADVATGHLIEADLEQGRVTDKTTGKVFTADPYPPFLQEIIEAGGLMSYTRRRFAS